MLFVAICAILALGFYSAGLAFVGAQSYRKTRDWHYLAGTILYACGSLALFMWVGNGLV